MMTRRGHWLWAALALAAYAVAVSILYRCTIHASSLQWEPYGYSELLINYSSGFVRRGFVGAWLRLASHGGSALVPTNRLIFGNFVLLASSLALLAARKGRTAWLVCLVLLIPGGVLHMAITYQIFYRKETFFYALLAACGLAVAAVSSASPRFQRPLRLLLVLAIVGLSILCALIHEAFVFLAAPAMLYLLLAAIPTTAARSAPAKLSRRRVVAIYSIAMLLLFAITEIFFHGGQRGADVIWQNLNPADRTLISVVGRGGIGSMALGLRQMWTLPFIALQTGMSWWYAAPIAGLMLYCLTLVGLLAGQVDVPRHMFVWTRCYLTILLCTLPAFVLGWDWGRWVDATSITFLIVWMSLSEDQVAPLDIYLPSRMRAWIPGSFAARISAIAAIWARFVQSRPAATRAVLLLFAFTFHLPELYLDDRQGFIVKFGFDFVRSLLHRHASPVR